MAWYIDVDAGGDDGGFKKAEYEGPLTPGMIVYGRDDGNWIEYQVNNKGEPVQPEYRYAGGGSTVEAKNINTGQWEQSVFNPTLTSGSKQLPLSVAQELGISYAPTPGLDTSGGFGDQLKDFVFGDGGDWGLAQLAAAGYGAYGAGNFINSGLSTSLSFPPVATPSSAGYMTFSHFPPGWSYPPGHSLHSIGARHTPRTP